MHVEPAIPHDYAELLAVWEDSVRATHTFITEDDIAFFKPLIIEHGFPNVALHCVKTSDGAIEGFIGCQGGKVEMLFVLDSARGKGIGSALLNFAVAELSVNKVDVNEQNPEAVAFYQHMGFHVVARSPLDDMGKPFPILHMTR